MAYNGFWLGDVADFYHKSSIEYLKLNLAQLFHRNTSATILPTDVTCWSSCSHSVTKLDFNELNFVVRFFLVPT